VDFLNPAVQELLELVATAWPEVLNEDEGRRIYEFEHIAQVPFEELTAPYAVLVVEPRAATEMGFGTEHTWLDCEVYYVAASQGRPTGIRTQLQLFREAIRADSLELAQVWDTPRPAAGWNQRLEVNQLLRGRKLPLAGGLVTFRLLTGEATEE